MRINLLKMNKTIVIFSLLFVISFCCIIVKAQQQQEQQDKQEQQEQQQKNNNNSRTLEVKVYYEALCIDSMTFFIRKLYPSLRDKNRLPYADLKLIPYGKVFKYKNLATNKTELYCQHGQRECELNALHACIIENNPINETLDVITCLMSGFRTDFNKCASQYGMNLQIIESCTNSRTIPEILDVYGQQTSSIDLSFVPSVEIDKIFDYDEQYELRRNFDKIFCRKFTNKFNYTLEGC